MTKPLVYLAGAMTHVPNRDEDWRNEATRLLAPEFDVLDPTKMEKGEWTPDEIVSYDYGCILRAKFVLVRAQVPSWGTAMELAFARHHLTPVVAWDCPQGKVSPWLIAHVDQNFPNLYMLAEVVRISKGLFR